MTWRVGAVTWDHCGDRRGRSKGASRLPRLMTPIPALTVVIPTYQRAATVERAVRSVLAQRDCLPFEVVVVDDGSTDETLDVLRGITDDRVRVLHQENAGRSAARNAGVAAARAPVVTFLDSDDEALPGWLGEVGRRI